MFKMLVKKIEINFQWVKMRRCPFLVDEEKTCVGRSAEGRGTLFKWTWQNPTAVTNFVNCGLTMQRLEHSCIQLLRQLRHWQNPTAASQFCELWPNNAKTWINSCLCQNNCKFKATEMSGMKTSKDLIDKNRGFRMNKWVKSRKKSRTNTMPFYVK